MATTLDTRERIIVPGPAGFHPPSAQLGVALLTGTQSKFHGGKTYANPLTFAPVAAGLTGAAAFGHSAEQMKREG